MSKIAIISRPDQHLLLDISGCNTFKEAIEQLSSTLLAANQFWKGQTVDLNLGQLLFSKPQLAQIIALTKGVGIVPQHIFAENSQTFATLKELEEESNRIIESKEVESKEVESKEAINCQQDEIKQVDSTADSTVDSTFERIIMLESAPDTNQTMVTDLEANDVGPSATGQTEVQPKLEIQEKMATTLAKKQALYIKQTLRAGQAVSHEGDLIIIGDVNAGAEVLAKGDIVVWGALRGIAHAGAGGDVKAEIRALRLQPIQIRIAHFIARSPDSLLAAKWTSPTSTVMAETAKLVDGKIRILRETFD